MGRNIRQTLLGNLPPQLRKEDRAELREYAFLAGGRERE